MRAVRSSSVLASLVAFASVPCSAQSPNTIRDQFLKVLDRPRVPLAPTPPRVTTDSAYTYELLSYSTERDETVPTLVVKRGGATSGRRPVVVVLHGTGGNKEGVRPLLRRLADLGFIGVAIDTRFHGERAVPIPGLQNSYQSAMLRAYRTGQGHPYLYDTVWDVMRLMDYLATRDDVDAARVGVVGNSKGGTEAYLAAAADSQVGVSAAFVRKFYQRIAPGLVDTFDGPVMLPLIAPRPMRRIASPSFSSATPHTKSRPKPSRQRCSGSCAG